MDSLVQQQQDQPEKQSQQELPSTSNALTADEIRRQKQRIYKAEYRQKKAEQALRLAQQLHRIQQQELEEQLAQQQLAAIAKLPMQTPILNGLTVDEIRRQKQRNYMAEYRQKKTDQALLLTQEQHRAKQQELQEQLAQQQQQHAATAELPMEPSTSNALTAAELGSLKQRNYMAEFLQKKTEEAQLLVQQQHTMQQQQDIILQQLQDSMLQEDHQAQQQHDETAELPMQPLSTSNALTSEETKRQKQRIYMVEYRKKKTEEAELLHQQQHAIQQKQRHIQEQLQQATLQQKEQAQQQQDGETRRQKLREYMAAYRKKKADQARLLAQQQQQVEHSTQPQELEEHQAQQQQQHAATAELPMQPSTTKGLTAEEIEIQQFDCIILDDDDDVVMAEEPVPQQAKISKKFEKRLITEVRRHPIIFDNTHKFFGNVAKRDLVWQKIGTKLKMDVDVCKTSWIELRYKYQSYARRLRRFFQHPPKKKQQRPTMDFENELMFLWRFVENSKYCAIPYEIDEPVIEEENAQVPEPTSPAVNVDDDLILIEQPVELIIIDEDEDTKTPEKLFRITSVMKTLVNHIKKYPELFDINDALFADYSRKSFVWNTIANLMGDKATKLMKSWIIMVTRYEWEVSKNLRTGDGRLQTELEKIMFYFKPYIMANPNTVYKNSYYLKQAWYEPIDYFKDIYNLIARMKRVPDIVYLTDSLLQKHEKTEQFFSMWSDLAKNRNCSVGRCETTWLIMHHFYWELMKMRKQNYHLTDKWYFEIIITELYDVVKDCRLAKLAKKTQPQEQQGVKTYYNKNVLNGNSDPRSTIPMVILHNPAVQQTKTMQTAPAKTIPRTTTPGSQQGPLPIISSAVSLAPQAMSGTTGATLQIRHSGGTAAQSIVLQPKTTTNVLINNTQPQAQVNMPRAANIKTPVASLSSSSASLNTNANETQKAAATKNPTKVTITQKRTKVNVPTQSTTNPTMEAAAQEVPQSNLAPLPKISGAVSLLNPNEILIELIASQNGNHLVVHGPPLSEKYNLPMTVVAKFIREILAIPLLHNKRHNQPAIINSYWEHISKRFNLPPHICRACWNFLLENFNHFHQIAPLKELMKPFSTTLKVWTQSSDLFTVFDAHANKNGWLAHISRLPEVVECIGTYPVLYKDVGKNASDSNTDMEALCAWRTIALRFPTISEISSIWTAFKNVFSQYMSDIEFGVDNKWPINWWRVFARLKFLVEVRYTSNEPYYYIVSNKMVEEIDRCAMIEMKKRYCKDDTDPEASDGTKPFITDEMMSNGRRLNVEMVALLTAIEKYPIIYQKGDCMQKYEAWDCVAKELQMDVTDCLVAFRSACQKYCTYKRQDSVSRCHLNQRYYKRFDTIFRTIKTSARNKLNIRTPFELNQSVDVSQDGAGSSSSTATTSTSPIPGQSAVEDLVFPERYISDISMSNCESNLVVKNWIYAMGNLPTYCIEQMNGRLRYLLNKYLSPENSQAT